MKCLPRNGCRILLAATAMCLATVATSPAIVIEIDYSLDTNGFFNQVGSKSAFRAVCDYYESILTDDLARIDPAEWTGESWTAKVINPATGGESNFSGKVVPANTVIIYAGGRALGGPKGLGGPAYYSAGGSGGDAQAWFDLLKSRGQARALQIPSRDFASWGGGVSFNSSVTWNFSLINSTASASSFVSTALHELGHIFGIGTAESWDDYISGTVFTGPVSTASFGVNVPLADDLSHWRDDGVCVAVTGYSPSNPLNILSKTIGQFGAPAGNNQIARMDPSGCQIAGNHLVFTELDVAALADIGWEIAGTTPPPLVAPPLAVAVNNTGGAVTLSWIAEAAFSYQVEEAQALTGWAKFGSLVSGQSGLVSVVDSSPPVGGKNFYRLEVNHAVASPVPIKILTQDMWDGERVFVETKPRFAKGCGGESCCGH